MKKKLAWDDKVSKYLPDFHMYDPWVTSELTVRDLVSHRVGLDTFSGICSGTRRRSRRPRS
jgi:CubicO group peptidase (beta-lactamase class C family)